MKQALLLLIITLLLPTMGWGLPNVRPAETRRARPYMGTIAEIVVHEKEIPKAENAIELSFNEIRRLDYLLSDFLPDSEISQVNRDAFEKPVTVSPEVLNLVQDAFAFSKASGGAFDITVRPLMVLWGFRKDPALPFQKPSPQDISQTLKKVGYQKVVLDPEESTIRFTQKGMGIDLGGIGKGYAVERAVQVLKENGIYGGVVSIGGDIFSFGNYPSSIGIQNPLKNTVLMQVALKNQAIATSGSYERFQKSGGSTYSHIMDPRTGRPVSRALSTSVIAKHAKITDALATVLFVLEESQGRALLKKFNAEGLWIYKGKNGKLTWTKTKGFPITKVSTQKEP